jgi:hypothetical protein
MIKFAKKRNMHLYNVTVNIEKDCEARWLEWMKNEHIPQMLSTGKFSHARMCKVLVEPQDEHPTYAVQYTAEDYNAIRRYYQEDAALLRNEVIKHFSDKVIAIRTELEQVFELGNNSN